MELTCVAWSRCLREHTEEGRTWLRLCTQWYPMMAARLILDGSTTTSSLQPALGVKGACSPAGAGASAAVATATSSACHGAQYPLAFSFLAGAAQPLAVCATEQAAESLPAWRALFKRRFLRQCAWDAEKRRDRRGTSGNKVEAEGDVVPEQKMHGKSGKAHTTRTRACKRCGQDFDPHDQGVEVCRWHAGKFAAMDEDGILVSFGNSAGRDFERRAKTIIKAHNRKKTSKRANMVVSAQLVRTTDLVWQSAANVQGRRRREER